MAAPSAAAAIASAAAGVAALRLAAPASAQLKCV